MGDKSRFEVKGARLKVKTIRGAAEAAVASFESRIERPTPEVLTSSVNGRRLHVVS